MLLYKVSKKYPRGPEQMLAKFNELSDAKQFAAAKLEQDRLLRVNASYLIHEGHDLIETLGEDSATASATSTSSASSSASGKATTQVFSPSPFQVAPRPGGMPPSSFKDVEDDKKK